MGSEQNNSSTSCTNHHHVHQDSETSPLLLASPSTTDNELREAPSRGMISAAKQKGRLLLLLVAFLYGSLSVSLRAVYARPGPPAPSILSATRGWMSVLCLWPIAALQSPPVTNGSPSTEIYSKASFYWFAFELAVFNFGTQGLLNIGLVTTASARSAFFTQLSVIITPILTYCIGRVRGKQILVEKKVWFSCFVALLGLYILSSDKSGGSNSGSNESTHPSVGNNALHVFSFGDWCCLGSAFCWSYYIYRLSDWGGRYDETQTMLIKNIFMAILYTLWTVASYFYANECSSSGDSGGSFCLWEGWRDPISMVVLFYTAASSGALCDVLQQTAQSIVPAAESNVLLSLEPVFSALLAMILLTELPSAHELIGGAYIIGASLLSSN
ncbi:unnamed protein product [Pseudo-nitzschia multistriata]|uniref:EamA domain-containing protein n=1 Tax=Pseudo-nitzschia multistriata TaxID=183589 RepID=A0A448ZDS6_9STRA|nr:unnamed protein product [Pseudo-nitzschia multistriata]